MSGRSFSVYRDTPVAPPAATAPATSEKPPLTGSSDVVAPATPLSPTGGEKENTNPVTGQRAGAPTVAGKKRKTAVLAAKPTMPLGEKARQESESVEPEAKKRKASTLRPKDGNGSAKKGAKKVGRRGASPMPKVEEDPEENDMREVTQALINERCYELTVSPLADVTEAYVEKSTEKDASPTKSVNTFKTIREKSVEPEISDPTPIAPVKDSVIRKVLTTPERRAISSTFTFQSPSPTSERYKDSLADPELRFDPESDDLFGLF
ncbi:hypothetical protein BD626DRAFT_498432 [Schizophyllum amplum]|uniref:Uncharacterized protein n=1 Tax=Schizophyllum amplum TaxID=97359 RepID=A0A550CBL3_9AGAR|nr:hypothetical protein BD626DRAFT_498432 [Auriculariopsis ampla]